MSDTIRPGDPIWTDLFTTDTDGAIAFYGELFGWTADIAPEHGNYITFRKDGKAVAGGMAGDADAGPSQWTIYLASTDAEATAAQVTAAGGTVVVPPTAVGDLGTFAVFGDKGGVGVGVWQSDNMTGFEQRGTVGDGHWDGHVGAPSWFELHTRGYDDALKFYGEAFGWQDPFTIAETPEFRYTTIHSTTPMLGGVMDATSFLPPGVPGYWTVYFGVEDVDASVRKVVELGGSIITAAEDTPYGRLAAVADPNGVRFSLGGNKS
ncbi:VOC family protein [Nocardia yunnanensis]|uniref:VOC family protein n=1 Tax=Nocardia yunnanensis TaxID=2382165 RepID=A0A386ZKG3_9NOCA|nr:VOC family protein [Nocardia yunnanensis]AYF77773.1 VOC family protein [Nocardia yunnanensis]